MSLTLHPKARSRLVNLLSDILPRLRVEHGQFLTLNSLLELESLDDVLPRNHADIGLVGAFSEHPLMHFVSTYIANDLKQRSYDSEATTVSLIDITSFKDADAAAERIIAAFENFAVAL